MIDMDTAEPTMVQRIADFLCERIGGDFHICEREALKLWDIMRQPTRAMMEAGDIATEEALKRNQEADSEHIWKLMHGAGWRA